MEPDKLEEARRLFYLGLERQTQGRLAEAEDLYARSLSLVPDRVSILTNLCVVLTRLNKHEAAVPHIDRILALDPENEAAWLHKAIGLSAGKRYQEALACCDRAIAIKPGNAEAHYNRGLILTETRRHEEALASFDRALAVKPDYAEALSHRGLALEKLKRLEEALASFDRALAIKPDYAGALQCRGNLLQTLGRHEEAITSFRAALASGADSEGLRYSLAALGADAAPVATPPGVVVTLFDEYAEVFDRHLTSLQYRAPQLLFDAVSPAAPAAGWDIADLGCGTGLCGVLFRPIARTLTGVDLSPNMIQKARERRVYDQLVQGEIVEFLYARARAFDAVVAADVLIYIGDLGPVFDAARSALRRGGRFAFSVETHEGAGFVLRPSRRYAQSLSYVRECAAGHGFNETGVTRVVLRKESNQDVNGAIVVLQLRDP